MSSLGTAGKEAFLVELTAAIDEFEQALLMMDRVEVERIIREAKRQSSRLELVDSLVVATFERLGQGWQDGSIALAQIYMAAMICEEVIELVMPFRAAEKSKQPRIGIAVLADHHALGKRIISSMLRASGYELIDYGHGVGVEDLVARTVADGLEVLLISTLMLPSALKVKEVLEGLRARGAKTKVIAGGAPFRLDRELAANIGVVTVDSASALPAAIQRMVKQA